MPIFEVSSKEFTKLEETTFKNAGLKERSDLQRLLRDQIEIIAEDVLVIAEEFGEWTESRRRIDLLGIDKDANLVVIELKRTQDGGHMELQALRYAAMVSTLTAPRAVEIFERYLGERDLEGDAEALMLEFLQWEGLDEDAFGQDVRIVLVSADFSRELTTAVMWLNDKDVDIRCTRIRPYSNNGQTLIDVQQIIPLPEAADYQVEVREKKRIERRARKDGRDFRRYDIEFAGITHEGEWKRNAIWLVVKHIMDQGVAPGEISDAIAPVRSSRVWYSVKGAGPMVPEEFLTAAVEESSASGRKFDAGRWRLGADDVVASGGRSYVFTKMWGRHWAPCLELIAQRWPDLGLRWWPSGEEKES